MLIDVDVLPDEIPERKQDLVENRKRLILSVIRLHAIVLGRRCVQCDQLFSPPIVALMAQVSLSVLLPWCLGVLVVSSRRPQETNHQGTKNNALPGRG
jgi:hypothetical protein